MTNPVLDHLDEIESKIISAPHLWVFLDFDGTLAPIDEDPDSARMPEPTRRALTELAAKPDLSVGIISGRALSDLRSRVGLRKIVYAGNHGLEVSGPGMDFVEPSAAMQIKPLGELARHLRTRLHTIPGVMVENKVLSASVHFRRAERDRFEEIETVVHTAVESIGQYFAVTMGRKVFEIRPIVAWNKGDAVHWIKQAAGRGDSLSIYMGDDATDEDAFAALPAGITVSVGKCAGTTARYCLRRQDQVYQFLEWLAEATMPAKSLSSAR